MWTKFGSILWTQFWSTGLNLGTTFFESMLAHFLSQVHGFWSWADWLKQQAADIGREPVFINLDETSVSKAMPGARGMVVGKPWWPGEVRPQQRVPKKDLRSMITHVGLCTHRTDLQGKLPQIFIGNHYCFTPDLMARASQVAPGKVKFWRRTSSWNNSRLMSDILLEIALVLTEFPGLQPILVFDCASIHLPSSVLRTANALGIWILPVPARCTFLLQPCDTHVFSPYKAYLQNKYRESKNEDGDVTPEAWARTLIDAATKFMCSRRWSAAFEQTGIIGDRMHLTRELATLTVPVVSSPAPFPLLRVVRDLLPRNRRVPYSQLVSEPLGRQLRVVLF